MPSSGGSGWQPWGKTPNHVKHDTSQQQGQPMVDNLVLLIASPYKICFLFPTPPHPTHTAVFPLSNIWFRSSSPTCTDRHTALSSTPLSFSHSLASTGFHCHSEDRLTVQISMWSAWLKVCTYMHMHFLISKVYSECCDRWGPSYTTSRKKKQT